MSHCCTEVAICPSSLLTHTWSSTPRQVINSTSSFRCAELGGNISSILPAKLSLKGDWWLTSRHIGPSPVMSCFSIQICRRKVNKTWRYVEAQCYVVSGQRLILMVMVPKLYGHQWRAANFLNKRRNYIEFDTLTVGILAKITHSIWRPNLFSSPWQQNQWFNFYNY